MSTSKVRPGKHRGPAPKSNVRPVRSALVTAAVAATATGVVVAGGVAADDERVGNAAPVAGSVATLTAADIKEAVRDREETVSRSEGGTSKPDAPNSGESKSGQSKSGQSKSGQSKSGESKSGESNDEGQRGAAAADKRPEPAVDNSDPRSVARSLMPEYGFSADQFGCLDALYVSESNWNMHADNPSSSAYGIPQALTETHDMPAGYFDSAEVQIRWGLEYIQGTYGTPCSAWDFKQGNNWY